MNRWTQRLLFVWFSATVFCLPFVLATLAGASQWSAATAGVVALIVLWVLLNYASMVTTTEVVEDRLTVRAPLERVHELLADPRHVLRWAPDVVSVDGLVGEPGAVGSRWRVRHVGDHVLTSEVVAAEPLRVVVRSRGVPGGAWRSMVIETERTLAAVVEGTEVRYRRSIRRPLLARVVRWFRRSADRQRREWWIDRLRAELERDAERARG